MEHIKCLIIGSGPAGYTAAIYAGRANLSPVLYCGLQMGGQLTQTTIVENFPGYPDGVDANQMMMELRQQAERFGADLRDGVIAKADFSKKPYVLTLDDGTELNTSGLRMKRNITDRVFLPVLPATDSSIARRWLLLLVAAILPAKRPPIWHNFVRRCI